MIKILGVPVTDCEYKNIPPQLTFEFFGSDKMGALSLPSTSVVVLDQEILSPQRQGRWTWARP